MVYLLWTLTTACVASGGESAWNGEYTSYVSGGQTRGGSPIMMNITLTIDKHISAETCKIELSGFQTYESIFCTTALNNDRLVVMFKSHQDGRLVNRADVMVYKVGDILFSLDQGIVRGKKKTIRYLAHWGAYTPFGIDRKNVKDYFEKAE